MTIMPYTDTKIITDAQRAAQLVQLAVAGTDVDPLATESAAIAQTIALEVAKPRVTVDGGNLNKVDSLGSIENTISVYR